MTISIGSMIKQCSGLIGTKDASEWEQNFIFDISQKTGDGKDTTKLSSRQVDTIENIYKKNFGATNG
jgi:hypothetical protein